jgi:hypothetical protein
MTLEAQPQVLHQTLPSDTWMHNFAPMPDQVPPASCSVSSLANDADARIQTLENIVKSLKKCIVGHGIHVGHFLFKSKEDLRIWMAMNVTSNRFGLFLDAFSVFDFLAQPHTDTEMNMNHLYASQKNVFETIYESQILFSMQNLFPDLFGKSSSDGMDTSQSLPGLPVYHLSISGILMALQGMHFCDVITATFEDSPDARDLSLKLLYQSKKFALDLCNFIQWDYKFWKHKGYSKKEAWELTCLSVQHIFEDIHVVCVVGWDSRYLKNPALTATQVVWAALRPHATLEEHFQKLEERVTKLSSNVDYLDS